MIFKELSRQKLIYILAGTALLVLIVAVVASGLTVLKGDLDLSPDRFDLSSEFNQQQYADLVSAHQVLEGGFNFDAATKQAAILFTLGDYKQAEKAWKYFIANRPRAIQGYWGLGEIYTVWERYADAEKNWLMAIEVDTPASYPNQYIKLSDLYRDHFPEKRYKLVQILTNAIAKNPTEINYPLLLANYYQDIGDKASAVRFYEEVLKLKPDAASAQNIRNEINALKS